MEQHGAAQPPPFNAGDVKAAPLQLPTQPSPVQSNPIQSNRFRSQTMQRQSKIN